MASNTKRGRASGGHSADEQLQGVVEVRQGRGSRVAACGGAPHEAALCVRGQVSVLHEGGQALTISRRVSSGPREGVGLFSERRFDARNGFEEQCEEGVVGVREGTSLPMRRLQSREYA